MSLFSEPPFLSDISSLLHLELIAGAALRR